jgi:hypothetical protein
MHWTIPYTILSACIKNMASSSRHNCFAMTLSSPSGATCCYAARNVLEEEQEGLLVLGPAETVWDPSYTSAMV